MTAIHPLTFLTWFLWGFFMGLGWIAAQGLMKAAAAVWDSGMAAYKRRLGGNGFVPKRKGPRFEYMAIDDPRTSHDLFNSWGEDGWELVSATDTRAWFKRALA